MNLIETYILPGEAIFPEGIVVDPLNGDIFVSSIRQGTIFRGNISRPALEVFLPGDEDGRTSALGLALDQAGRLFVAGGSTGLAFVYERESGRLLSKFAAQNQRKQVVPGLPRSFINDVIVSSQGDAYFTDSFQPIIYRIRATAAGESGELEAWLDLSATALEYVYTSDFGSSMNLNGIVISKDGRYLITVQTNTGKLFRVDISKKEVTEIDLADAKIFGGDGLVLQDQTLYAIHHDPLEPIMKVALSEDFSRGKLQPIAKQPSLKFPTTAALHENRLIIVNGQFDRMASAPDLPFSLSSFAIEA